ncbi:acyltransferase [Alteromonas aestuariivivens]|uniref:Acyltransferase n=1 Tax=Alteromonas aestuariivivens TaxID=1938339 RepID=A0A3D8MFC4_9ALTE|nr:acyltransferase [Alteromonas aestuariivivens]RDV29204.1 acyltransferase [Alteromonas aestuariivivens]
MKNGLKQILFTLCAVATAPLWLSFRLLALVVNKDSLLAGFSQLLSLLPGKCGTYLRAGFYRFTLTHCAPNAVISFLTLFSQQDTEIAEGCYIGPQCNIGKCSIGRNTLVGSGVHIMSGKGQHNFDDPDTPIKDQGGVFSKISIGENCWLGNGALVMANVGAGSVVAAGAVVVNDVPEGAIVGGNPAKVIKMRGETKTSQASVKR